jgi:hypothetical protein
MSLLDKLENVDRRILYWLLFIGLMVPFLNPLGLPIRVTEYSQGVYDALDALEPGDVVVLSINGGVSAWPEILPAMLSCVRMCVRQDANLVVWGFGHVDIDITWDKIKTEVPEVESQWTYGEDYAYFGYLPNQETTVQLLSEDIRRVFSEDTQGNSIDSLPVMQNVNSHEDVALVLTSDTGEVAHQYVRQWASAHNVPLVTIGIAMGGSSNIPFYKSGLLVGMSIGSRGGAEMEKLVGVLGEATVTMDSINVSHIFFILAIILTNVIFFIRRTREQ